MRSFGLILALTPFVLSAVEAQVPSAKAATLLSTAGTGLKDHPEAKPFGHPEHAEREVAAAMVRAKTNGHKTLVIFGGNWCHDSRAVAGWFATPRFRAMLADRYEIVWVDVGRKTKNLDLARRFGLDGIAGTPTVLMLDSDGRPTNLADAPTWRNASTRGEDAIFDHFAKN